MIGTPIQNFCRGEPVSRNLLLEVRRNHHALHSVGQSSYLSSLLQAFKVNNVFIFNALAAMVGVC
jgi:hypothetical protein